MVLTMLVLWHYLVDSFGNYLALLTTPWCVLRHRALTDINLSHRPVIVRCLLSQRAVYTDLDTFLSCRIA